MCLRPSRRKRLMTEHPGWYRIYDDPTFPEDCGAHPTKSTCCIPGVGRVHYEGRLSNALGSEVIASDGDGGLYAVRLAYWCGWDA